MFRWTPEAETRAELLLSEGCPYREIARTIGCHHVTVMKRFPDRGWTRSQVGSWAAGSRWRGEL